MMEISTSTYYADPKISRSEKEEFEADIRGKIEEIRIDMKGAGYRQLLRQLKRMGIKVGERRLRRVIREAGLQVVPKKRFIKTTDSEHDCLVYPNLIQGMTIDGPNQVWASDITYIRITNGFVYLSVILDLFSRKVIGWAISKKIDGNLTLDALNMAILRRRPKRGVIHHSDRGVQYLCKDYVEKLLDSGFHISCSRKGNPYDNAWVESFMSTLKKNEVHARNYETILDVVENVPRFIEEIYNKKRLHSSLGHLPPEEFEDIYGDQKEGRPTFTL